MEGTAEETTVYEIDSGNPGPTVMLTGGIHGSEANGYRSAEVIMNWDIDAGRMVVIPRCNKWGIERDSRTYDNHNKRNIDLNRQFPPGRTPTTPLARAIWNVAVSEDIDFLIDMHSSHGIYRQGDGVGQGIFSTAAGNATAYRKRLVSYMNENVITDSTFAYSGATSPDGSRPMLKHKVGADLNTPGMIIESTYEYDRSIATQVQNTTAVVREFFREYGLITRSHNAAADNALLYHDDAAVVDASVDDNGKRSGLSFTVTNDADSSMWIQDVRIEPANDDIDGLSDHSYDEGKWVSELFIDADVRNGVTDLNGGTSLPTIIDLDTDGFSDSASIEAVLSSGSSATVHLYQFESDGSPVDMAGESVDFTVSYGLDSGAVGSSSFTGRSASSGSGTPSQDSSVPSHGSNTSSRDSSAPSQRGYLAYNKDAGAVDTPADDNEERSGITFSLTNKSGSNTTIRSIGIEPANDDIDRLSDHSYSEGKWVSELAIDADVRNGVTDINGGTSLPTTIDLGSDGFSDSASTEAVLSSGSTATAHCYQFESNGTPVDMAGEAVEFTVDYELGDGTSKTLSFTAENDSSGSLTPSHPLGYDGTVTAIDTPEDDNGERSGLSFEVTNDASSNLIIERLRITPSDGDIDELRDHSYSEGKWVSELAIDADVQNGVTDINGGMSLPGSIDLDTDGFSNSASVEAVLSSDSSATINLYQFRASGPRWTWLAKRSKSASNTR
ncbi:hypothetical protein A4G99_05650 [Haladaptatus sp. R4]|uniref:M99 family carboxypeptidase catalytic domain-containing protein n=1 Tax=Haladaptatus sp. R4 TaxID=1679489 RepID=UPI0007B48593|nr:succinylglutamate desuccinylase/aspartoacylase family protein [Haladaptatus sp. R4]KZN23966.1 hypothetical protein A4G99_05650 [Haladaptatus sp. R4]